MDIRVAINDEAEQQVLSHDEVERLVCAVLAGEECVEPCEVSVSFVTVEQIHELNREYRGIDKPTDVLSFNIDDPDDFDFEYDDEDDDLAYDDDDRDAEDEADEDGAGELDEFDPEADDEGQDADEADEDEEDEEDEEDDAFDSCDGSFDLDDAFMLGDVILCPQIVEEQAAGFGNTVADEMRLLLVHGCLHLMGYDHEVAAEAEEMEGLERWYLSAFASVPADQINVGPTVDHAAEGTAAVPREQ